jgi:hypothetical protein
MCELPHISGTISASTMRRAQTGPAGISPRITMPREALMIARRGLMLVALLLTASITAASGNVITDWDETAVSIAQPATGPLPPTAVRTVAIADIAMFEAVNAIELRYKPYKIRLPATPDTSKEAAAVAAAAAVLIKLVPDTAADVQSSLTSYLATLPDGEAKSKGIQLGQAVAAKLLEARTNDGASAADAYRPKTKPGVYIPTPITFGWQWATMTPFALQNPS